MENISHLGHELRFEFLRQDVCQAFDCGKVEYVFHFASPASPIDYLKHGIETLQIGSLGSMNCLDLARKYTPKWRPTGTSRCTSSLDRFVGLHELSRSSEEVQREVPVGLHFGVLRRPA